jgi:hypothetical protein
MDNKMPPTPLNNIIGLPTDVVERFIEKIDFEGPGGCWVWTGCLNDAGYGTFRWGKQGSSPVRAHRLCYELSVGPIPSAHHLHHLVEEKACVGPSCVNPDHLQPTTAANHILNLTTTSRAYVESRQTHCVRGHEFNEENTHFREDGKRQCRLCANETRRAKYVPRRVLKDFCSQGHPLSGENLVIYKTSKGGVGRGCKACRYAAVLKHHAANGPAINAARREKRLQRKD